MPTKAEWVEWFQLVRFVAAMLILGLVVVGGKFDMPSLLAVLAGLVYPTSYTGNLIEMAK